MPDTIVCSGCAAAPWFYALNHWLLAALFRLFPHTDARMNLAQFFIHNRLASEVWFAVACYYFWSLRDEQSEWRRARILEASAACLTAAIVMLAVRPFIGSVPPSRAPEFQQLFPPYLWDFSSGNSFPSHSTLVYLVMAGGLWPINRRLSAALCGWALLTVSLPRVYMGGHYPTDVFGSIIIAAVVLALGRRVGASRAGAQLLDRLSSAGSWIEIAMFLWFFELGDGFHSALEIGAFIVRRVFRIA
jgi:membrane-associated phospholipid phosphatase